MWVEDPHIKAKGLGKEGKLVQEWNVTENKVKAPGFCPGEEGHRGHGSRWQSTREGDKVRWPCLRKVVAGSRRLVTSFQKAALVERQFLLCWVLSKCLTLI